jgi:hypothetical protein
MRLISTTIALSLTVSSIASASGTIPFIVKVDTSCPPAVRLNVGDKVTDCPRIGLSDEADLENRKQLVEGDFNIKIIDEQKKMLDLKDLQISYIQKQDDLWKADALREREAYDKERSRSNTSFWVGFGVGLLTVVVTGYALGQVHK